MWATHVAEIPASAFCKPVQRLCDSAALRTLFAMLQQLLFAWLEEQPSGPVYLHADGNYMGYAFCGNLTGDEAAAGQSVTVEGHTAKLKPGKCSQRMMQGYPYITQKPRDFKTRPGGLTVHWDGKVWCP